MRDRTLAAVMLALLFGGIVLSAAPSGKEAPGGAAVRAVSSPTPPRALPTARGGHVPASEATTPAPSSPPTATPARTIPAIIAEAAREFGVAPETLMTIARCESSLRPTAIGDGGLAIGLFQWHAHSFAQLAPQLGYDLIDIGDPVAQSRLAAWAMTHDTSTGGGQASADPAGGMT